MRQPLLTIITSTLNSGKCIGDLISSIKESRKKIFDKDIEWIVIDGNSTDNTIKLLESSGNIVDQWITEKDTGIYEAWNKGLVRANGEYITFIGSDDLIDPEYFPVALNSIKLNRDKNNVLAFKMAVVDKQKHITSNHTSEWTRPKNFPVNLGFYHPGTIFSKTLFINQKFDESFKVAGDREHSMRVSHELCPRVINSERHLITYSVNGISGKKRKIAYQELVRLLCRHRKKCDGVDAYLQILYLLLKYPLKAWNRD